MKYARLLKETRQKLGMTQSQLGARARLSLATIQNIESGRSNPELATLESLLDILGLQIVIRTRQLDWNFLCGHGLPLLGVESVSIRATKQSLLNELTQVTMHLNSFKATDREGQALVGFLWALRDHFPGVWHQLDGKLKSWFEKRKPSSNNVKLRRIALGFLAEYL